MRIKLDLDEELQIAIQEHLDGGVSVQNYVRAALRYFNAMRDYERSGNICGFGNKSSFRSYNTEVSPSAYLGEI
jgi:hypothetical protein